MKTIAICQVYNEEWLLEASLRNIVECGVDLIILTEGLLSPHGAFPKHSTDKTLEIINRLLDDDQVGPHLIFIEEFTEKYKNKLHNAKSREATEGINKNFMLECAITYGLKDGDVLFIKDIDEFMTPSDFRLVQRFFKKNPHVNYVRYPEKMFAYNLQLMCTSSSGRFLRYREGSRFGTTNHFIHPNGVDITKSPDVFIDGITNYHLSYCKNPLQIREKVLSFNRSTFTFWYNNCFLELLSDPELAYANNAKLPWGNSGFLEGSKEKLYKFYDKLPKCLQNIKVDWSNYIKENKEKLKI